MFARSLPSRLKGAVFSRASLAALLAVLVVAVFGIFADHQNSILFRQRLEAKLLTEIGVVRAQLEGSINGNIQLVRGLVAVVATEPDIDQKRFDELGSRLFSGDSQLRSVAGAPNLVISLVHPLEPNRSILGFDYRAGSEQRDAALRAISSPDVVLAGPVELIQGGLGIVGRFPVYTSPERTSDSFWGLIAAVLDFERLITDSGLLDADLGLDIAIRGKDALGASGEVFYGDPSVFDRQPVVADVLLPSGSWQIAALPKGGWPAVAENAWLIRALAATAALLLAIPLFVAGRLAAERDRHIAALERRRRRLAHLSKRLELALDVSRIGVWQFETATRRLEWDARIYEMYGLSPAVQPSEQLWADLLHPDDRERALEEFETFLKCGNEYVSEFRIRQPDGTVLHQRVRARRYLTDGGTERILGAEWDVSADVALARDLERAKNEAEIGYKKLAAAKARIEHDSLHDPLTRLPNRRFLDLKLSGLDGQEGPAALLHMDLDRFKQINDTLGHGAGDAMLVHAARILQQNTADGDFVARVGGDEFILLRCGGSDAGDLSALAERIISQMRQPVEFNGHDCRFGVSIGIACHERGELDARRLLVNADLALYRAKGRGRSRHEFFTDDLQAEIVANKRTADDILSGLERNEFLAHYQPQFDARTLELVGVEALARWNHPMRGLLRPDAFLSIAEDLNVVATLDREILDKALADLSRWRAAGLKVPRISVNVSAKRLREEGLVQSLRELDLPADSLTFELVESIFLDENDDLVVWNIEQIKSLGIDIEIDDFGTGYASIVSLLKLKPRRLKIDRQLIMPLVDHASQRELVQSIIEIGHSLGIEVVAEGVETLEHARILRLLGCDILQGFAFSGALDAEKFQSFVSKERWLKAS